MNQNIKLICMDVDGTMLDAHRFPAPGIQEAIQSAQAQGIRVVLATGRNKPTMMRLLDILKIRDFFIGSDGAYIANPFTNEVLECRTFPSADARKLVRIARLFNVILFLEHADWMLCEKVNDKYQWMREKHSYEWQLVPDLEAALPGNPIKALVSGGIDELEKIRAVIHHEINNVQTVWTGPQSVDVLSSGISKGSAIRKLAKHFGIPLEQVLAIGDGLNDIEMLQAAGIGVAMGNAHVDLKASANVVAPSNEDGGAAWAIQRFALKR